MKKMLLNIIFMMFISFNAFSIESYMLGIAPVFGYTFINSSVVDDSYHYGVSVDFTIMDDAALEVDFLMSNHDVDFGSASTDMDVTTFGFYGAYYMEMIENVNLKLKGGITQTSGDASAGSRYVELEDGIKPSAGVGIDLELFDNSSGSLELVYVSESNAAVSAMYRWFF